MCVQQLTASLGIVTKLATISVRQNLVFNPLRHLWVDVTSLLDFLQGLTPYRISGG
ncbi:hypothetical protein [Coleofasciculus sp. FACHB-64]|uniref:hypothetical protein n=1 Tax=Cyanophyceae TaxID=3028117 RepID=UPI0016839409|nr:hypothetical protein [Coleofasciculus sp. FACHB-64]